MIAPSNTLGRSAVCVLNSSGQRHPACQVQQLPQVHGRFALLSGGTCAMLLVLGEDQAFAQQHATDRGLRMHENVLNYVSKCALLGLDGKHYNGRYTAPLSRYMVNRQVPPVDPVMGFQLPLFA
ncbi:hypothetical protein OOK27_47800 [Streptomyces canus]|uniref:hypothetical protein n=1 Tax=Streptomyces canus TaxID=58343 RepID=UPI002255EE38|nr:hypothetical protein [Streptomyces canus]MCX5261750.1 hypothetical protein [Streptomyces canus]